MLNRLLWSPAIGLTPAHTDTICAGAYGATIVGVKRFWNVAPGERCSTRRWVRRYEMMGREGPPPSPTPDCTGWRPPMYRQAWLDEQRLTIEYRYDQLYSPTYDEADG